MSVDLEDHIRRKLTVVRPDVPVAQIVGARDLCSGLHGVGRTLEIMIQDLITAASPTPSPGSLWSSELPVMARNAAVMAAPRWTSSRDASRALALGLPGQVRLHTAVDPAGCRAEMTWWVHGVGRDPVYIIHRSGVDECVSTVWCVLGLLALWREAEIHQRVDNTDRGRS